MKNLVLLFGGQATEHEVSCRSVLTVIKAVNREKYHPILIGITKAGEWIPVENTDEIEDGSWRDGKRRAALLPDATLKSLVFMEEDGSFRLEKVDIVFPVLHGKGGEDGTVQGLLELAEIPYVGCGVLSSAVSMDKISTKLAVEKTLERQSVRQAKYIALRHSEWKKEKRRAEICTEVAEELHFPVFVKPSNAGSSCGVSKVESPEMLIKAVDKALEVDRRVLIEEFIRGRELECAVFSDIPGEVVASSVGEIKAAAEFYDYDAKYNNPDSKTELNPELPSGVEEKIQKAAKSIFLAVDGFSLSRVDFFFTGEEIVFNEINTLPGFTSISMYPMLFNKAGWNIEELVERLISSAEHRPS